jgi:hypothetical protein
MNQVFFVTRAAASLLGNVGSDAAKLFARHLSGDSGLVGPELAACNERADADFRLSCYWLGERDALCIGVVSTESICMMFAVEDMVDACWVETGSRGVH